MRSLLPLLLCFLLLATDVQAEDDDHNDDLEDQFRNLITQQLSALRSGDAEAAWSWAHPNIKGRFLTAERFYTMAVRQYQPLTEFSVIRFRELEAAGDNWVTGLAAHRRRPAIPGLLRPEPDQPGRMAHRRLSVGRVSAAGHLSRMIETAAVLNCAAP